MISIFASCKNDEETSYIISGNVFGNSTSEPIANKKVELYKEPTTTFPYNPGEVIASTYSNAQGAFYLEYAEKGIFTLQFNENDKVIYNYNGGDLLQEIKLFAKPVTTLTVNLDVAKPYTSADTLFLLTTDANGNQYMFAGPFTSGKLTTLSHYQIPTNMALNAGKYNTVNKLGYTINRVKVIEAVVNFDGTKNAEANLKIE